MLLIPPVRRPIAASGLGTAGSSAAVICWRRRLTARRKREQQPERMRIDVHLDRLGPRPFTSHDSDAPTRYPKCFHERFDRGGVGPAVHSWSGDSNCEDRRLGIAVATADAGRARARSDSDDQPHVNV
jgi:hypothetical protein